jgi:hypothetical protein
MSPILILLAEDDATGFAGGDRAALEVSWFPETRTMRKDPSIARVDIAAMADDFGGIGSE